MASDLCPVCLQRPGGDRAKALHLPIDVPSRLDAVASVSEATVASPMLTRDELKRLERDSIARALEHTSGKVSGPGGAAELLGLRPTTLASRIAALGLRRGKGVH